MNKTTNTQMNNKTNNHGIKSTRIPFAVESILTAAKSF